MSVDTKKLTEHGTHTVVVKVDLRNTQSEPGLKYEVTYEVDLPDCDAYTAIAQAGAKVSKELRLPHPGDIQSVSWSYSYPE